MTAGGRADDAQELRQEIEQTREQLGETVEQLVAKTDLKARARDQAAVLAGRVQGQASQAREQAAVLAGRVQGQASQAREQAAERARKMRGRLAGQAGRRRQPAVLLDTAAGRQSARVAEVGATAWQSLPEPARRAAAKAADTIRQHRVPLAAAAGVLMAGSLVIWWRTRR